MYTVKLIRGPRDKHGAWANPPETRYYGPDKNDAIKAFNAARHVSMARHVILIEDAADGVYRLREFQIQDGRALQSEVRTKLK